MAREHRPDASTPVGATPIGAKKKGGRGRLIGLILAAIVILAVLALLLSRCGSGSESSSGAAPATSTAGGPTASSSSTAGADSTAAPTATGTAVAPAPAPGASGASGAVTSADGQSLVDLAGSADPATALAAVSGQAVTGTGVQVLSVPADEGFWVGSSDTARVWVQLTGGGESGYQVTAGDLVDFTGTLAAHDATFASTVGVDDTEGAAQLSTQAQHVEVAKGSVTLSTP